MDHTQAYSHCFTKTHAHVHLCRCQQACIEQSEKHTLTVCPCEDEGRTKQRKDGGSNAALPDSKSCANGWRSSKDLSGICQEFVRVVDTLTLPGLTQGLSVTKKSTCMYVMIFAQGATGCNHIETIIKLQQRLHLLFVLNQ